MPGHGDKRPRLLKRAARMLAQVQAAGGSYAEAARRCGISRASMFRWVGEPGFLAIYEAKRQELLRRSIHATAKELQALIGGKCPAA
jgi:hypothetical protein